MNKEIQNIIKGFRQAVRTNEITLDASFKKDWAKALRSGEYKQAKSTLRRGDGFCCLGVACDLIDPAGWRDDEGLGYWRDVDTSRLPYSSDIFVDLHANIDTRCSVLLRVAALNDNGFTFEQIADLIEEIPDAE